MKQYREEVKVIGDFKSATVLISSCSRFCQSIPTLTLMASERECRLHRLSITVYARFVSLLGGAV